MVPHAGVVAEDDDDDDPVKFQVQRLSPPPSLIVGVTIYTTIRHFGKSVSLYIIVNHHSPLHFRHARRLIRLCPSLHPPRLPYLAADLIKLSILSSFAFVGIILPLAAILSR